MYVRCVFFFSFLFFFVPLLISDVVQNLKDLAYAQSRLLHKHEDDAKEFEMALAREGRALIDELHKLAKFGYGQDRET